MELTNVLVIGGGAAGLVSALAARSHYPDKDVMLIHKEEKVVIPYSIPYLSKTRDSVDDINLTDFGLRNAGVDIRINEVISINSKEKKCLLEDSTEIIYEKLILATDSIPLVPDWLKGTNLHNVFTVPKDHKHLELLYEELRRFKKIVVIGAGFTGIEMSTGLKKMGKDITLIEIWPYILDKAFDEDLTEEAEKILLEKGINILKENGVKEIVGETEVKALKIEYADVVNLIKADAVVLAMGYELDTEVAKIGSIASDWNDSYKVGKSIRSDNHENLSVGACTLK